MIDIMIPDGYNEIDHTHVVIMLCSFADMQMEKELTARRIIQLLIEKGADNVRSGRKDPRFVEISGGIDDLRNEIGLSGDRNSKLVRKALNKLGGSHVPLPNNGRASLMIWSEITPMADRPASIQFILGSIMMPRYQWLIGGSHHEKSALDANSFRSES